MSDDTAKVRHDLEVDRLSADLRGEVPHGGEIVEDRVRADFGRWSQAPVQDFVSIFVQRHVRGRLRAIGG